MSLTPRTDALCLEIGMSVVTNCDCGLCKLKALSTELELAHQSAIARVEVLQGRVNGLEADYQRIIKQVLACDPILACERADDQLEPPWEVIKRTRLRAEAAESELAAAKVCMKIAPDGHVHEEDFTAGKREGCFECDMAIRALTPSAAPSSEQPVAYRIRLQSGVCCWYEYVEFAPTAHRRAMWESAGKVVTVEPLYAHPSALDEGWIAVSERLPEISGARWVEVWLPSLTPSHVWLRARQELPRCTHWRFTNPPLPAPPSQAKGGGE